MNTNSSSDAFWGPCRDLWPAGPRSFHPCCPLLSRASDSTLLAIPETDFITDLRSRKIVCNRFETKPLKRLFWYINQLEWLDSTSFITEKGEKYYLNKRKEKIRPCPDTKNLFMQVEISCVNIILSSSVS